MRISGVVVVGGKKFESGHHQSSLLQMENWWSVLRALTNSNRAKCGWGTRRKNLKLMKGPFREDDQTPRFDKTQGPARHLHILHILMQVIDSRRTQENGRGYEREYYVYYSVTRKRIPFPSLHLVEFSPDCRHVVLRRL